MADVNREVDAGRELIHRSGAALDAILSASTDVLEGTTHVVVASEEHAASSEKIRHNMGAIAEVTAATVRRNRDIAASAEELGRQMEDLRQRIARFQVA